MPYSYELRQSDEMQEATDKEPCIRRIVDGMALGSLGPVPGGFRTPLEGLQITTTTRASAYTATRGYRACKASSLLS